MKTIEEAKKQANRLSIRLSTLGVEVKRTQALEGVAAIHGFPSWNHMSAQMQCDAVVLAPPPKEMVDYSGDSATSDQYLRYNIFAGPSGVGKSFTLGRLAAWLTQRGQRVAMINLCSFYCHGWDKEAFPVDPIEIEVTHDQRWEKLIQNAAGGASLYVNIRLDRRPDNIAFLIAFVRRLRKEWPYDWLLVDEFDYLSYAADPEWLARLLSSADVNAKIVVVSRIEPIPDWHPDNRTVVFRDWLFQETGRVNKCSPEQNNAAEQRLRSRQPYPGLLRDMIQTNNFLMQQAHKI